MLAQVLQETVRGRLRVVGLAFVLCSARPAMAQVVMPTAPSLTLRMLFDSVQAHYPAIQAAQRRVHAAQGSLRTARAFGNPLLNLQVDQISAPRAQPLIGMPQQSTATATFPLEDLFQRGPRVAMASAEVRVADAEAMATRQRLGLDASAAYYRTVIAQVEVTTARDLVSWLDTLVAYNRVRVREGATAEADLLRSELERDRASAEQAMVTAELAHARAALSAFVSDPRTATTSPLAVVDATPYPWPSNIVKPGSINSVFTTSAPPPRIPIDARPDVRADRERVDAANAGISAERTLVLRALGATVGAMRSMGMTSVIAGISMPLPIFDRNSGRVQRATAARDAAVLDLSTRELAAAAEVRGAYEAASVLTERASALAGRDSTNFLTRADESRRIALGAYREGAMPLFQVIDAARAWSDARLTYFRTMIAQHQSILNLIVAAGLDVFASPPVLVAPGAPSR